MTKFYQFTVSQCLALMDVSSSANKVYVCMRLHWNTRNQRCDPGLHTIKRITKLSINTIREAINELEQTGLITTIKEFGVVNRYFIEDEIFGYDELEYEEVMRPKRTRIKTFVNHY